MNIDRNAPVMTRDKIVVAAPLQTVWNLFTDINGWSGWNKHIEKASLDDSLAVGATIRWTTAGFNIASIIGEMIPHERIVWSGDAPGFSGIHLWQFTQTNEGVIVETAESCDGEFVRAQISQMQSALDQFLRSWLESLKQEAEARYRKELKRLSLPGQLAEQNIFFGQ